MQIKQSMNNLREHISKTITIADIVSSEIVEQFTEKKLAKDKTLIRRGQICDSYIFVESGALKIVFYNNGIEITNWVAFENTFFTLLESYNNKSESEFSIIALENSVLLLLKRAEMDYLLNKYPQWQKFMRLTYESAFLKLSHVVKDLQVKTASEIYTDISMNKDINQRVKLKDLSSMIGITKHTLSRIRKRKK